MWAERVARVAVKHLRATQPDVWARLVADNWLLRVANPGITIKAVQARQCAHDPELERHVQRVKHIERREYLAVGAAGACVAWFSSGPGTGAGCGDHRR